MLLSKDEKEAVRSGRLSFEEARRLFWRRLGLVALGIVFMYGLLWAIRRFG